MQGTPKRPNPSMPRIDVPIRIIVRPNAPDSVVENGAPIRAEEATPRGVYLKKEDFEKYGYTDGCEGCRRLRPGGMQLCPHTHACRVRIEAELQRACNPRYERALEQRMIHHADSGEAVDTTLQPHERKRQRAGAHESSPAQPNGLPQDSPNGDEQLHARSHSGPDVRSETSTPSVARPAWFTEATRAREKREREEIE